MPTYSEQPLPPNTQSLIEAADADGHRALGLSDEADPQLIIMAIDECVSDWQLGNRQATFVLNADDTPYTFGSVWGYQMVRQFQWEWVNVIFHDHDERTAPAVVSPDRSLAIYPIHFLIGCFADPTVNVTIALAFNRLAAGEISPASPGSYTNLMDSVRRVAT